MIYIYIYIYTVYEYHISSYKLNSNLCSTTTYSVYIVLQEVATCVPALNYDVLWRKVMCETT